MRDGLGIARSQSHLRITKHGQTQDRADRRGTDRRHACPSRGNEGTGRRRPVRHRRGHARRARRSTSPKAGPSERLRRRRCRAPTTTPTSPAPTSASSPPASPRKPGMSRDDLLGINLKVMKSVGEGIAQARAQRLRDLHHQPAGRDGLGAARILGPAARQGLRHGRRAGQRPLPPLPEPRIRRLDAGRHRLRAGRPRRHDGAADPLFHRRRHPAARSGQDGLDHAGKARRHRPAHPRRRRRDRRPAENRLGVLRARHQRHRDGRSLSEGPEAPAALRGLCATASSA